MKKQFIAKLLALALVLSMVPVAILGASAEGETAAGNNSNSSSGSTGPIYVDTTPVTPPTTTVDASDVTVEDGSATIEAKVVNGNATVVVPEKALDAMAEQVTGDELVLKIEAPGATKVDVSIPAKALTAFAEKTGANLTYELGEVATISIPNEALATVFGTSGNAKISAQASGSSIGFTIQVSGRSLKGIKGLQVTF